VFEKGYNSHKIKTMRSQWPSGQLEVNVDGDEIKVTIRPLGGKETFGNIKFPKGIRFLSASWWRWRSLCSIAEKEFNRRQQVDDANAKRWEVEEIDIALVQTFPEIIEEQIFGDNDDN